LLAKKSIRTLGLVFSALALITAIVAIVLAGISYQWVGPDWKAGYNWGPLPALQIATIIFSFAVIAFAFLVFFKPNITMTIIFSILVMLSLLFNLAIAIYSFVGASHGWVNTYFGCNGRFNGVMDIWQGIDAYLQEVDMALCGPNCPCYFTNTTGYLTNSTIAPYYQLWEKTNRAPGNIAFQNCSAQVQAFVYNQAAARDAYFDPKQGFNAQNFFDYMQRIETQFNCAGWCNITYYNPNYNRNVLMSKFMFSDVNRGPPYFLGCLNRYIETIPPYLNAWGSMAMLLFGIETILFALALCQCWAREKDHEAQIPHHHDENRQ